MREKVSRGRRLVSQFDHWVGGVEVPATGMRITESNEYHPD